MTSLVLIVLVSASELQDPATVALRRAAAEVLGSGSTVELQTYETEPDDAALTERARGADAVAEIVWTDQRRRARVHCYVGRSRRFVNRELAFEDIDEPGERGRMLGFALASILPELPEREPEPPRATPAAAAKPGEPRSVRSEPSAVSAPQPLPSNATVALDTTGLFAIGLGSPGSGLGLGIAGRWLFQRSLSLRLAAGARYGNVAEAQAKSAFYFTALGLGFQFNDAARRTPWSLGGRVDALLTANTLRRMEREGEVPQSQTRYQPAADLLLEGAWYFWRNTALLAAGGAQLSLGHTDVVIQGREVADIAQFRFVSELGIRTGF